MNTLIISHTRIYENHGTSKPAILVATCNTEQSASELAYRYNSFQLLLDTIAKLVTVFVEPDKQKQNEILKQAFELMKQQNEMKGKSV